MSSQYQSTVSWAHNVTRTDEKATQLIELAKSVADAERNQDDCSFYVVLSPREGQHFSQPTRLEIIMNHEEGYLEKHRSFDAYKKFQDTIEKDDLLDKSPSNMSFTPKAGFTHREQPSNVPAKDQYLWVAKLDSHPGKFDDFLEAIKIHASNVERTENETLSFLVLQSHDTENSVTLFERYTNEEYFRNVHSNSESMQEYKKKMETLMANGVTAAFQMVAGFVDKREQVK